MSASDVHVLSITHPSSLGVDMSAWTFLGRVKSAAVPCASLLFIDAVVTLAVVVVAAGLFMRCSFGPHALQKGCTLPAS